MTVIYGTRLSSVVDGCWWRSGLSLYYVWHFQLVRHHVTHGTCSDWNKLGWDVPQYFYTLFENYWKSLILTSFQRKFKYLILRDIPDYGRDGEVYVTVDLPYKRYTFPAFGTDPSAQMKLACSAQSQFNKTTWTCVYKCLQVFVESLV